MIPFKVCCIQSAEEAALAASHGAWALGLVSWMPSGPGVIAEAEIARIAAGAPPEALTVLLTSSREAAQVAAQVGRAGVGAVQLCDGWSAEAHRRLRDRLPETRIVQVVHVEGTGSVEEALGYAARPEVDMLLLDSGRPKAPRPELGGTGRAHDWSLSAAIVAGASVPVVLAGGLSPENVAEAVRQVRPFGVDICTGLRTAGRLDADKLARFAAALAGDV